MPSGKSSRRRTQRYQMFIALQNYIENENFDCFYIVGDFNVTLSRLDSSSSLVKSVDCFSLKTLQQQNNHKDSFRIFNPQSKSFHASEAMQPHHLIEFTSLQLDYAN